MSHYDNWDNKCFLIIKLCTSDPVRKNWLCPRMSTTKVHPNERCKGWLISLHIGQSVNFLVNPFIWSAMLDSSLNNLLNPTADLVKADDASNLRGNRVVSSMRWPEMKSISRIGDMGIKSSGGKRRDRLGHLILVDPSTSCISTSVYSYLRVFLPLHVSISISNYLFSVFPNIPNFQYPMVVMVGVEAIREEVGITEVITLQNAICWKFIEILSN